MATKRKQKETASDVSLVEPAASNKRRRLLIPYSNRIPKIPTSFSILPADYPTSSFSTSMLKAFVNLLKNPVIEAFHAQDVCNMSSEQYLIAIVFSYFVRSDLPIEEYTVFNFFCALYLAHDIEEECDDYKWEILPWALGKDWAAVLKCFIKKKNEMWSKMRHYGMVSRVLCNQIFEQVKKRFSEEELRKCPLIVRKRDDFHSNVIKQTIRRGNNNETSDNHGEKEHYAPKGPIWHQGSIGKFDTPQCKICLSEFSLDYQHKVLFEKAREQSSMEIPDIPTVLSQGLDIKSDSSDPESSFACDSDDEWEPKAVSTRSNLNEKSAGCTGRPKKWLNDN